jgi:oxygen-independent coproporphyrinogen-3 oxidase
VTNSLALYLHVPFCAVRCHYCDFNTYAGLDNLFEDYADALVEEIRLAGAARRRPPVRTVFIGGGTPTVLPAPLLASILTACRASFDVAPDAEITSEANPGTADAATFAALRDMGVNRLSMGVQSLDDAELKWLGRIHSAAEAEDAFAAARRAGFDNVNLDFMFGLPGQAEATWRQTLERAVALAPEHISLYSLTVEHGTPLYDAVRRGVQPSPEDDLAADFYLLACDRLTRAGYAQYEISNWSRPGFQCRHNLIYWRHEPYLGFGPGAHSYAGDRRWWNVRPVPQYIQRLRAGQSPERDGETIDERLAMGETMMLGLRLVAEGVEFGRFRSAFGRSLDEVFGDEIRVLQARGLLETVDGRVRLTAEGRLLGNQVFAEFLPASKE